MSKVINSVNKDIWIKDYVQDLSFVDIGGLWGTVNEKVTVASKAGAKNVTMIDIQPIDYKWWTLFHERCKELDVLDYQYFQADICQANAVQIVGTYDFVHCSGIIYHVADIFNFLKNLYEVSQQYLILTSMIIPDVIENQYGRLDLTGGQALCVPLLSGKTKQIVAEHFDSLDIEVKGINTEDKPEFISSEGRFRTGPWWWLFSPSTLRGMVQLFPFEVIEEGYSWQGRSYSLLLKVNH